MKTMLVTTATTMTAITIILSLGVLHSSSASAVVVRRSTRRTSNNNTTTALIVALRRVPPARPAADKHSTSEKIVEEMATHDEEASVIVKEAVETCLGYYDVMGQWDASFHCRTKPYVHCCGTCGFRFCCQFLRGKLEQSSCHNDDSPDWAEVAGDGPGTFTHSKNEAHYQVAPYAVLAVCGVGALLVVAAVFARVGLRKVAAQREIGRVNRLSKIVQQEGQQEMGVLQHAAAEEELAMAVATLATNSAGFQCETSMLGADLCGGAAYLVPTAFPGQHSPHQPHTALTTMPTMVAMPTMSPLSVPIIDTLLGSPKGCTRSIASTNSLEGDNENIGYCHQGPAYSRQTARRSSKTQASLQAAPHPSQSPHAGHGAHSKVKATKMYSYPGSYEWQEAGSAGTLPPRDLCRQGSRHISVDHSAQQLTPAQSRGCHRTYTKREVTV